MRLAAAKGRILAVTYNYSGYPMIRQARAMVAAGELGRIRVVQAEYAQDWLTEPIEAQGRSRRPGAPIRPGRVPAGASATSARMPTSWLTFVTGLELRALCADLTAFVPGRRLDDNAHVLLRFGDGAKGVLWASQVAPGNENGLSLRVYGETGGFSWRQEEPERARSSRATARQPARDHARRGRRRRGRRARHARARRAPGRLPRRIRDPVSRDRRRDPRGIGRRRR